MKISEALKKYREEVGLSQKAFIKDIISPAQYSRIEKGTQEVNLSTILLLLTANHINVIAFIEDVLSDYTCGNNNSLTNLSMQVMNAYYDQDLKELKDLLQQINQFNNAVDLKLRTKLVILFLENKGEQTDPELKKQIINEFLKRDNWTENTTTLHLLEQAMLLFDFDQISLLMNSIFRRYKNIQKMSFLIQDRISGICANYLYVCYQNHNIEQAQKALDLLENVPKIPELFVYQLLIQYYKALFTKRFERAKEIKDILSTYGLEKFSQSLPY